MTSTVRPRTGSSGEVIDKPSGRDQKPMQAGDFDVGCRRGPTQFASFLVAEQVRFIAQGKRRQLDGVIAERGGKVALLGKGHFADDLIAKGDAHYVLHSTVTGVGLFCRADS